MPLQRKYARRKRERYWVEGGHEYRKRCGGGGGRRDRGSISSIHSLSGGSSRVKGVTQVVGYSGGRSMRGGEGA